MCLSVGVQQFEYNAHGEVTWHGNLRGGIGVGAYLCAAQQKFKRYFAVILRLRGVVFHMQYLFWGFSSFNNRIPRANGPAYNASPGAVCNNHSALLEGVPGSSPCSAQFGPSVRLISHSVSNLILQCVFCMKSRRARLKLLAAIRLRTTRLQSVSRTHLVQYRIERLLNTALLLQAIGLSQILPSTFFIVFAYARTVLRSISYLCIS